MTADPTHNMDLSRAYEVRQLLPDTLPESPLALVQEWLHQAVHEEVQPNPNAMTLATAGPDGRPSARIILCKGYDAARGYFVFYTNRDSHKGRELAANPNAALLFHWDTLDRQIRVEGEAVTSPDTESDAYFRTRPIESRIGAHASQQSEPIDSREALLIQVVATMQRLGVQFDDPDADIPRPEQWGGYRLWARAIELWVGGPGRVHDRARWERTLNRNPDDTFTTGSWTSTRLQP